MTNSFDSSRHSANSFDSSRHSYKLKIPSTVLDIQLKNGRECRELSGNVDNCRTRGKEITKHYYFYIKLHVRGWGRTCTTVVDIRGERHV